MTLQAKGAFHGWIQTFFDILKPKVSNIVSCQIRTVQVDRNNRYKDLIESVGGRN